jgi:hypothetical protein
VSRQRQPRNGNWTNEQLQNVIAAVENALSIREASTKYHIPYSSFRDWCYGNTRSRERGTKGMLTANEENQPVEYLIEMCNIGLGLSPT